VIAFLALLRKEAEALIPYALGFGLLSFFSALGVLWETSMLHEGLAERLEDANFQCGIVWVMGLLVGHGAVAHEWRDGHVEFLDGLPTRRGAVYAAKVVATHALLTALVAASFSMDLTHDLLTAPPAGLSSARAIAIEHATMLVSAYTGLAAGMLLSWIGGLAWGLLVFAFAVAMCAGTVWPPLWPWMPGPGTIGTLEFTGVVASHPLGPPLWHLTAAGLAVAASGVLFGGPGRHLTAAGAGGLTVVRAGLVGCVVLAAAPLVALFLLSTGLMYGGALLEGRDELRTEHFRVLFTPSEEPRARELAAELDDISAAVAQALGVTEPLELDVELLGAPDNHLGVFTGGKIRLAHTADRAVIAHELTHAYAFGLAGRAAWDHRAHTHFFEEGAADWVMSRVTGEAPVPPTAGAVFATGQVRFEELVDSAQHQKRHDITQSYVLGRVFTHALALEAGDEAPGCLFRALGTVEPGTDAPGLALWYTLAATCGIDLDAAQDRWLALLAEAAGALGPVPVLRTRWEADTLVVTDELGLGWRLHCGFRDDRDGEPSHWVYVPADADGRCAVPARVQVGHSFQAQVGFEVPGTTDRGTVFLPWTDQGALGDP
jgi:hypothetical protein